MPIVEYNMYNLTKCQCPKCPVQAQSNCAQGEIEKMMAGMQQTQPTSGGMPDPKVAPGLYCAEAVGKASCSDLDFSQMCICGTCPVHQENNLNAFYYCRDGSAEVND